MTIQVSSLSIAIQGIADFLDGQFGEDVAIITESPQKAAEKAKTASKHFLNLFFYRVMPSGFHASTAADEPLFVRVNALLTPFLTDQDTSIADADLRILGNAIRVLHSNPVIPTVLPSVSADPEDFRSGPHIDYRLQAILQAPSMEELNHIWTTQGGDLAYRISAAYEFALIPIEPIEHAIEAGPVTTSILDVQANMKAKEAEGFISYGDDVNEIPIGGIGVDNPPPATNWLPVVLFTDGDDLSNSKTITDGTASIDLALAGPPGERVALEVSWLRADSTEEIQTAEVFTINSTRVDDPAAVSSLNLDSAADGDVATILTRPVDDMDQPLASSAFANTLSITVGGV